MAKSNSIGSVWRKWDLHVHSRASLDARNKYNGDDAEKILIDNLIKNEISAIAVTDHSIIAAERILKLRTLAGDALTIFPGVEVRTDKGASNIHVTLVFPETLDVTELANFFTVKMLKDHQKDKLPEEKVYWTFEQILKFANHPNHNAIISIHAGSKSNSVEQITNHLNVAQAMKTDIASNVDIYEIGKLSDIDGYEKKYFQ